MGLSCILGSGRLKRRQPLVKRGVWAHTKRRRPMLPRCIRYASSMHTPGPNRIYIGGGEPYLYAKCHMYICIYGLTSPSCGGAPGGEDSRRRARTHPSAAPPPALGLRQRSTRSPAEMLSSSASSAANECSAYTCMVGIPCAPIRVKVYHVRLYVYSRHTMCTYTCTGIPRAPVRV